MNGSLSIKKRAAPWSDAQTRAYLIMLAVGLFAALAVAFAHTPLQRPGHKALFWLTPLIAARLKTRAHHGAALASLLTAAITYPLAGRIGGGGLSMLPILTLAGILIDRSADFAQNRNLSPMPLLTLFAAAGALANLLCLLNHISELPTPIPSTLLSYTLFGALSALLGVTISFALPRRAER